MNEPGQSVRLNDWLDSRSPRPPIELSRRLAEIVGDTECKQQDLPTVLIDMAEKILAGIGDDRSAAADLLAADSLITYAMEAAADGGDDVELIAADAAARIAAVKIA